MSKPTVYVDTNIFSFLFYRGRDSQAIEMSLTTRDWWGLERPLFHVWTSRFAIRELEQGRYPGQDEALSTAVRQALLAFTAPVRRCGDLLLDLGIVPAERPADATHLAFAAVHAVDYLLTWNHAHLANAATQEKLNWFCKREGWRSPWVVSPESIPKAAFGQEIRRHDEEASL